MAYACSNCGAAYGECACHLSKIQPPSHINMIEDTMIDFIDSKNGMEKLFTDELKDLRAENKRLKEKHKLQKAGQKAELKAIRNEMYVWRSDYLEIAGTIQRLGLGISLNEFNELKYGDLVRRERE